MKTWKKHGLLLLSIILAITLVLAGCGSGSGSGSGSSDTTGGSSNSGGSSGGSDSGSADSEPLTVKIVTQQVNEAPPPDNEFELMLEELLGAKLDIQWTPGSAYDDKVSVMIASGDLPDILMVGYSATYLGAIRDGLFWEVGPFINDYPNLAELNPLYYDNIKVDGKVYGIPIFRTLARSGIIYRKDWFDKFGLDVPKTTEEWYEVHKAIVEGDANGNGMRDEYALMLSKSSFDLSVSSFMNRLAVSLGAPNMWGEQDGQLVPSFMTPEYRDVLAMFRRLYVENLINRDFAITENSQTDDQWTAGNVGVQVVVANNAFSRSEDVKNIEGAEVDVAPLQNTEGRRVAAETGNNGFLVFPKSTVKTEEHLRELLRIIDRMLDEDVATLLSLGIEGVHWERKGENGVWKDYDAFFRDVKPYRDRLINMEVGGKSVPLEREPIAQKALEVTMTNLDYMIPNPALTYSSATYTERGAELNQMIVDAQIKYVMNEIDDDGFDQEIQKWLDAGGSQIIADYTEQYNAGP